MADGPPPPPPPPHGANPKSTTGGLPPGNYDIFVIPPHSSGSGFLYLPSMNTQRNSFLAGVGCTLFAVLVWTALVPVLRQWLAMIAASGGAGIMLLVAGVAVAAWAFGKTQGENANPHGPPPRPPPGDQGVPDPRGQGQRGAAGKDRTHNGPYTTSGSSSSADPRSPPPRPPQQEYAPPPPPPPQHGFAPPPQQPEHTDPPPRPKYAAPPKPPPPPQPAPKAPPPPSPQAQPAPSTPQSANTSKKATPDAASSWEKAREETRKREEARKRAEELQRVREEALRRKEEAERQARASAEKLKWEQARAREKEAREREAREKMTTEQAGKDKEAREREKREREARERIERERREREKTAKAMPNPAAQPKKYERPSAQSYASTETVSAYDARTVISSATSAYTESSYAPSTSTARTSPPPEYRRGPYNTSDPDKIVIKAVYMYTTAFPKPVSQLVSGEANVTDGLVLRLTTEGLFIDDDVRRVPQREWDVKAWGIKVIESGELKPFQILRATLRDMEGKRYIFVLPSDQGWKLDMGLARLRKGSQVRSMGMSGIKVPEMKNLLGELGWI